MIKPSFFSPATFSQDAKITGDFENFTITEAEKIDGMPATHPSLIGGDFSANLEKSNAVDSLYIHNLKICSHANIYIQ